MDSGFSGTGKLPLHRNMSEYGIFYHLVTLVLRGKKILKDP